MTKLVWFSVFVIDFPAIFSISQEGNKKKGFCLSLLVETGKGPRELIIANGIDYSRKSVVMLTIDKISPFFCFGSLHNFLPDSKNFTLNCFDMTSNKSLFISSNLKLENLKVFLFDYGIWCKIKSIKMESCKSFTLF